MEMGAVVGRERAGGTVEGGRGKGSQRSANRVSTHRCCISIPVRLVRRPSRLPRSRSEARGEAAETSGERWRRAGAASLHATFAAGTRLLLCSFGATRRTWDAF